MGGAIASECIQRQETILKVCFTSLSPTAGSLLKIITASNAAILSALCAPVIGVGVGAQCDTEIVAPNNRHLRINIA